MKRVACLSLLIVGLASCTAGRQPAAAPPPPPVIPSIVATPTGLPTHAAPIVPAPKASVLAFRTARPTAAPTTAPATHVSSIATYDIELSCVSSGKRKNGQTIVGSSAPEREAATRGAKLSYSFSWQRDDSSSNPVVSLTKKCTMQTVQTASGSEPGLQATLACSGSQTYDSGATPQPTSAISRSWSSLAALTTPFTHTMTAPKYDGQRSENDSCTLSIV